MSLLTRRLHSDNDAVRPRVPGLRFAASGYACFDPVVVKDGRYMPPTARGYGITMKPESLERFAYPSGEVWAAQTVAPM